MKSDEKISKGELTRQRLIMAAQALFSKKGFTETSVDEIVESIDLTIGVFYANFKSKNELLKVVLAQQIARSRLSLLTKKDKESDRDWTERVIRSYLSEKHRDTVEFSCPLTTMSQEIFKLGLQQETGLAGYIEEFEKILKLRLESIRLGSSRNAPALMAMCIGALQNSRLIKNKKQSSTYLENTIRTAIHLAMN